MLQIPMIGTTEKTKTSKFQVTLVDKTDKSLHPMNYPRRDRFFDTLEDRNIFISLYETAVVQQGGRLIHKPNVIHLLFESFDVADKDGNTDYGLVVYR